MSSPSPSALGSAVGSRRRSVAHTIFFDTRCSRAARTSDSIGSASVLGWRSTARFRGVEGTPGTSVHRATTRMIFASRLSSPCLAPATWSTSWRHAVGMTSSSSTYERSSVTSGADLRVGETDRGVGDELLGVLDDRAVRATHGLRCAALRSAGRDGVDEHLQLVGHQRVEADEVVFGERLCRSDWSVTDVVSLLRSASSSSRSGLRRRRSCRALAGR